MKNELFIDGSTPKDAEFKEGGEEPPKA